MRGRKIARKIGSALEGSFIDFRREFQRLIERRREGRVREREGGGERGTYLVRSTTARSTLQRFGVPVSDCCFGVASVQSVFRMFWRLKEVPHIFMKITCQCLHSYLTYCASLSLICSRVSLLPADSKLFIDKRQQH